MINIPVHAKIHNRFDFFLTSGETGETKQVGYAENIILDALWTKFFNSNPNFFKSIHLGTGSGTLVKSRTSLFTFQVAKDAGSFSVSRDIATGICSRRGMINFIETEQIGVIFSEIGIASSTTSSTLMTHALIRDMNGNVVTIEKTATDILTVYATIYAKFDVMSMHSGKTRIFGSYDAIDNDICNWMLGSLTSLPSCTCYYYEGPGGGKATQRPNSRGLTSKSTTRTLDAANKKVTYTAARLAVGDANFTNAGIGSISGTIGILFCLVDHPLFSGTEILNESIGTGNGIITDFKTKNPWIHDVTIKVDGVAVTSGITISENEPNTNDISALMIDLATYGDYTGIWPNQNDSWGGSSYGRDNGGTCIFENPYYATLPIYSLYFDRPSSYACSISTSDDLVNWTIISQNAEGTITIPEAHRSKRYWKAYVAHSNISTGSLALHNIMTSGLEENKIKFVTPPGLVTNESVGTGDGTEDTFTLPHAPIAGSLVVKLDGVETTAYTLDGAEITFTAPPGAGVAITASYRYSCNVTADYTTGVLAKDINYVIDFSFSIYFDEGTFE